MLGNILLLKFKIVKFLKKLSIKKTLFSSCSFQWEHVIVKFFLYILKADLKSDIHIYYKSFFMSSCYTHK